MSSYSLVNPLILGDYGTEFYGNDQNEAANNAWNSISKHMTGNVPRFGFTLKDNADDKLYHYLVKEKISNNKIVDYSIDNLELKMTDKQEKGFINHINNLNNKISSQVGGKHEKKRYHEDNDDDSSSSSSDSDKVYNKLNFYTSKKYPFYYWWYNPLIYTIYGSKYNSVYIPTFTAPFYPYIELDVSSAFFA